MTAHEIRDAVAKLIAEQGWDEWTTEIIDGKVFVHTGSITFEAIPDERGIRLQIWRMS